MSVTESVISFLCLIALFFCVRSLFKDYKENKNREPEKSKKEFLLDMYMGHGWDYRKSIELSIKQCLDNEDKPIDSMWFTREDKWDWYQTRVSLEKDLQEFDKVNIISFKQFPLSTEDKDEINKHHIWYDGRLKEAALKKSQELQSKDIETFKIVNNVLITEEGYYVALYEKVKDHSSTNVESYSSS